MKNLILILHALVLVMTLSIVVLPKFWVVTMVGDSGGVTGLSIPWIWTAYIAVVFLSSAITFSWVTKQ